MAFILTLAGAAGIAYFVFKGASSKNPSGETGKDRDQARAGQPSEHHLVAGSKNSMAAIPLFRAPAEATKIPVRLGLKEAIVGGPAWHEVEPTKWQSMATMRAYVGGLKNETDVDNEISCQHLSTSQDRVQQVNWTAMVFNDAGSAATLSKFKELCLAYCKELGCQAPSLLFDKVDPAQGQHFETNEAFFDLKRTKLNFGHAWKFTIESK